MVHAFLVLAAEEAVKSETLFFVLGCVFAAWAVIVGTLGLRSESFGGVPLAHRWDGGARSRIREQDAPAKP